MTRFDALGLAPALLRAVDRAGLSEPTPIQERAIPLALAGRDVLGLAQTGTGKTLAFGLPLIDRLMAKPGRPAPRSVKALILAPTRELVNQIAESLGSLSAGTRIRVAVVVGGQSIGRQIKVLAGGTDILVATPGRLIDLMERRAVDLSTVRHLVLDEADQMLDMGFIHALRRIAPALGTPRQTMLFSATMPSAMEELSRAYLSNPERVQVAPPGKAADKVAQSVEFVEKADKPTRLREILDREPGALTLVFARTKHGAERLMKGLVSDGHAAASLHGNKSQNQRDRAIRAFREGQVTVLVATDVAARGIDIPDVAYVVNYELPEVPDAYVHRIGRTARAGRDGEAIALCSAEEAGLLRDIEAVMGVEIPTAAGTRPTGRAAAARPVRGSGGRGGRAGSGGGDSRPRKPGPKPARKAEGAAAPKAANGRPRRRRTRRRAA
jgi:ATP-dependent RNA helicase RhlE